MTLSIADRRTIQGLQDETLDILRSVLAGVQRVAVLDAPNQRNVGDSLIWAGQRAYLRRLGIRVTYAADRRAYSPSAVRRAVPRDGAVLIHGGGNFGDIWETHQAHREQVAADLPDRKLVQLPQSIWFDSPERAAASDRLLGAHPDFTLLLRDRPSAARATTQLPSLRHVFCHDMALGWEPQATLPGPAPTPALIIARTDNEGASGLLGSTSSTIGSLPAETTDWTLAELDSRAWRAARLIPRVAHKSSIGRSLAFRPVLNASFDWINNANIRGGVQLFAGRRVAVVDRLHAHVLAAHLGIPHVAMDNSYGKIASVFEASTGRLSTAHFATDVEEALAMAAHLSAAPETDPQDP